MKKILYAVLVSFLIFTLSACNKPIDHYNQDSRKFEKIIRKNPNFTMHQVVTISENKPLKQGVTVRLIEVFKTYDVTLDLDNTNQKMYYSSTTTTVVNNQTSVEHIEFEIFKEEELYKMVTYIGNNSFKQTIDVETSLYRYLLDQEILTHSEDEVVVLGELENHTYTINVKPEALFTDEIWDSYTYSGYGTHLIEAIEVSSHVGIFSNKLINEYESEKLYHNEYSEGYIQFQYSSETRYYDEEIPVRREE